MIQPGDERGSASPAAVLRRHALPHHQPAFTNAPLTLFVGFDGPLEIAPDAVPPDMDQLTFDRLSDSDVGRDAGTTIRTLRGDPERQASSCHVDAIRVRNERSKGKHESPIREIPYRLVCLFLPTSGDYRQGTSTY